MGITIIPSSILSPAPNGSEMYRMNRCNALNENFWDGLQLGLMSPRTPQGEKWIELSVNRNDGVLTNGPTWVPVENGYALDFDGVNDYIKCGNETQTPNDFTANILLIWRSREANDGLIGIASAFGTFAFEFYWTDSFGGEAQVQIRTASGNSVIFENGGWVPPLNTEVLLTITRRGDTITGYENGVAVISESSIDTGDLLTGDVTVIGKLRDDFAGCADAVISGASIYNRALFPSESQHLHQDPMALVRQKAQVFSIAGEAPVSDYPPPGMRRGGRMRRPGIPGMRRAAQVA